MFTEYEIESMIAHPEVKEATKVLKKNFLKNEAPYLEINDEDFFSLIIMTPTIDIAMADGKISFFEEVALNKKARKLSKGGYLMKKDPVIYAMSFLIKHYHDWSDKFLDVLKQTIQVTCGNQNIKYAEPNDEAVDYEAYRKIVLHSPYILIRFIASFFLEKDEDIINQNHKIGKKEFQRMIIIGKKLDLNRVLVFQMFCKTFK